MNFVYQLAGLVKGKQVEIGQRGLMSFPIDSDQDQDYWSLLEREIAVLTESVILKSPTTPIKLPIDNKFPARMLYYFMLGDYEEHDMQLITRYVELGARVLELGGGVGLTGSLLGFVSGNDVTVCEPNPILHSYIERTFAANDIGLNLVRAAAVADDHGGETVSFHASPEYWWSSIFPTDGAELITVQAIPIGQLITDSRADTLVVDVEGYEVVLLADGNSLQSINTILVEIHTPSIGTVKTSALITKLIRFGFSLVDIGGHTFVFIR